MTKKDFVLIAEAIRRTRAYVTTDERTLRHVAGVMAEALGATNAKFDRERFLDLALGENR